MTDEQDIEKLSQQFLDLWQKQLSETMKNPEMIGQAMQMMHTMQEEYTKFYHASKTPDSDAARAAVSEPSDDELLQLDQRIRACEERLDQLESSAKKSSG